MKKNIDVVYFYEHAARELDVACAVKNFAQRQHGLSVEIFQWPCEGIRALRHFKPKIVVMPFCYQERSHRDCLLEWRNCVYFSLNWEELFYSGNRAAKSPRGDFACRNVLHHAWGKFYEDFLIQNGVPSENIFLNANPAYALYQEPYRRYFESRDRLAARYRLDPGRRWILFPENYNWAFYTESSLKQMIAGGQSPEQVEAMRHFCRSSLAEVIGWCREAAVHEGVELIVRPRPATPMSDFMAMISAFIPDIPPRMHVIQEESVREWILASEIVFSSHSTSLIEAAVSGKPVYMVQPIPIPSHLEMDWHRHVHRITTKPEFIGTCTGGSRDDEAGEKLGIWARQQMMAGGDGIWNLAGFLGALCRRERPASPIDLKAVLPLRSPWRSRLRFCYLKSRRRFGRWLMPNRPVPAEYEKDVINRDDFEDRMRRWDKVLSGYLPGAG